MTEVCRVEKNKNFTVVSNYHLRDARLTFKAAGLLTIMLSLPDNWDYTIKGLGVICRDGVDSIRTGIKELETAGYITRTRLRLAGGQLAGTEYIIREHPDDGSASLCSVSIKTVENNSTNFSSGVCRVEKNNNYTVLSNSFLQDLNLSLKAIGMLAFMLSLPDDWDYTIGGMAKIRKEGKDSIRNTVVELEKAGYISRSQTCAGGKGFGKSEYIIREVSIFNNAAQEPSAVTNGKKGAYSDSMKRSNNKKELKNSPKLENPTLFEKPMQENPTTGKPMLENPTQINTYKTNTKQKNTKKDFGSSFSSNVMYNNIQGQPKTNVREEEKEENKNLNLIKSECRFSDRINKLINDVISGKRKVRFKNEIRRDANDVFKTLTENVVNSVLSNINNLPQNAFDSIIDLDSYIATGIYIASAKEPFRARYASFAENRSQSKQSCHNTWRRENLSHDNYSYEFAPSFNLTAYEEYANNRSLEDNSQESCIDYLRRLGFTDSQKLINAVTERR